MNALQKAIQWPTTDEGWCARFKNLDRAFATSKRSPLHHDNRCPVQGHKTVTL